MFITEADRRVQAIYAKSKNPAALTANRKEIFGEEVQDEMKEYLNANVKFRMSKVQQNPRLASTEHRLGGPDETGLRSHTHLHTSSVKLFEKEATLLTGGERI